MHIQEIGFSRVTEEQVYDKLLKLNERKATGHDGILPKLLKTVVHEVCHQSTYIVSKAIKTSSFPNNLKKKMC